MKCPYCAETIQKEAIKCRYCNEWLEKPPSNQQHSPNYAKQGAELLSNTHSKVFGDSTFPAPSDNSPFEINKYLSIAETYFIWEGKKYDYLGVEKLIYNSSHFSLNLIIQTNDASIKIFHKDIESCASAISLSLWVKGKTNKRILFATPYIKEFTFKPRALNYVTNLRNNGEVLLKDVNGNDVTLHSDGTVTQKGTTLKLKTIFQNQTYVFGTQHQSYGGFHGSEINPQRIMLAYEEKALTALSIGGSPGGKPGLTLTTKPKIDFIPESDFDVICMIFKHLGGAR